MITFNTRSHAKVKKKRSPLLTSFVSLPLFFLLSLTDMSSFEAEGIFKNLFFKEQNLFNNTRIDSGVKLH